GGGWGRGRRLGGCSWTSRRAGVGRFRTSFSHRSSAWRTRPRSVGPPAWNRTGTSDVGSARRPGGQPLPDMTVGLGSEILADGVTVQPLGDHDVPAMVDLLAANRAHLDRWLRWSASVVTSANVAAFVRGFEGKLAAGDGFHCGIRVEGVLAGGVVCWYINRQNRNAEV